jgi:hypothetical protein
MWEGTVNNGTGPYTYSWHVDGHFVGSDPTYTGGIPSGSTSGSFRLKLVVETSSEWGESEIIVYEDANAQLCINR